MLANIALAHKYISIVYSGDRRLLNVLDVLAFKTGCPQIKEYIYDLIDHIQVTKNTLTQLSENKCGIKPSYTEVNGISGFFKECFFLLEDTNDSQECDEIILQTLNVISQYNLGILSTIGRQLRANYASCVSIELCELLQNEKKNIGRLELLTHEYQAEHISLNYYQFK